MTTEIDKKLIAASKIGDLEEITKLITAGADIHAQDEHQLTPVHWLARNGFIDALEFVLKKNSTTALFNQNNNTPLHSAAYGDQPASILTLLHFLADIHAKNKDGDTPLHSAAWKGSEQAIATLADNLPYLENTNNDGDTALHLAAWNNKLAALAMLIKKKANINHKNNDGDTPLHLAIKKGHSDIILFLLVSEADLKATNQSNQSPLDLLNEHKSELFNKQLLSLIDTLTGFILTKSTSQNSFFASAHTSEHLQSSKSLLKLIMERFSSPEELLKTLDLIKRDLHSLLLYKSNSQFEEVSAVTSVSRSQWSNC